MKNRINNSLTARSKLSEAIYVLAVGEKDIRHRLYDAKDYILVNSKTDFPIELQQDFFDLKQKIMNSYSKPKGEFWSIKMDLIRNITGHKIAKNLLKLYDNLDQYCRQNFPERFNY